MTIADPATVLTFWYTPETQPTLDSPFGDYRREWFESDLAFDQVVTDRFLQTYEAAAEGRLDDWLETPRGALALVIVLDQFPRNMFRGDRRAFAMDAKALAVARDAIARHLDESLSGTEKLFLYMPFQHSEDAAVQWRSLELYAALDHEQSLRYAEQHHEIIMRFGRFPHRNVTLGRQSTVEERAFLKEPNSSF